MIAGRKRSLWKTTDENSSSRSTGWANYEDLLERFTVRPRRKTLGRLSSNALVVVQEVCLTAYFMERHNVSIRMDQGKFSREFQVKLERSNYFICVALLCVVYFSSKSERAPPQSRRVKVRQRLIDAILLGMLLRFLASLLRSLTASYSSDTVQSLAHSGMVLHLLACDYSYANGKEPLPTTPRQQSTTTSSSSRRQSLQQRPPFQGGTISLNAALFSTTLLVSRLTSNVAAYFLICMAIVLFAFFPVPRSAIAASYPPHSSPVLWILTACIMIATILLMETASERLLLINSSTFLGGVIPLWKYRTQSHKRWLRGPWDIPSASSMQLDYHNDAKLSKQD